VKAACLAATLLLSAMATAQDIQPGGPLTASIGIDQNFDAQVPMNAKFLDQHGNTVSMKDVMKGKPAILLPMFFGCNGVCRLEVEDLFKTLEKDQKIQPGRDFELILLSINPTENPEFAKSKLDRIYSVYSIPGEDIGVHGLVGDMKQIRSVTDAVGFRFTYKPATQQINHPAGLIFLDKTGVVRGYMYGAQYPTEILVKNLEAATVGEVAIKKPEIILMGCVMVDPVTGKRTLVIENVMKVIGTLFALTLGGCILFMSKKYKTPQGGHISGV
jgi:protein SCO1/2